MGTYDTDFEAAYAARKQNRDPSIGKRASVSPPVQYLPKGREEILQSLESNYERERSRSKSNDRVKPPGPEPRSYAPRPTQSYNFEDM